MVKVHPSVVVGSETRFGRDVSIGPFCVIEDGVQIGDGCRLASHVVVKAGTELGPENEVGEGTVLGGAPQHLRAGKEQGALVIGRGNVIREHVTIHRGLTSDSATRIGDKNLIMVGAHIAHDCVIGAQTIIASNVLLAGHVSVEDRAYLSGAVGVHQFTRIGQLAMVGGQSHANQDVPPFVTVDGRSSLIVGLNLIGLRRAGFSATDIQQLKAAYRIIYRSGLKWSDTLAALREEFPAGPAADFYPFLAASQRGVIQERRTPRGATVALPDSAAGEGLKHVRKAG